MCVYPGIISGRFKNVSLSIVIGLICSRIVFVAPLMWVISINSTVYKTRAKINNLNPVNTRTVKVSISGVIFLERIGKGVKLSRLIKRVYMDSVGCMKAVGFLTATLLKQNIIGKGYFIYHYIKWLQNKLDFHYLWIVLQKHRFTNWYP